MFSRGIIHEHIKKNIKTCAHPSQPKINVYVYDKSKISVYPGKSKNTELYE